MNRHFTGVTIPFYRLGRSGVVRWCWINLQCQGVLLICIIVEQGPTALAVGAGGGCLDIFLSSFTSLFFLPLWETARYRLKYCLKEPFNPNQPINPFYRRYYRFTGSRVGQGVITQYLSLIYVLLSVPSWFYNVYTITPET